MHNPKDLETTLALISSTPVSSDDEYLTVLRLISDVAEEIGPTATLILHLELSLRLYNALKAVNEPRKSLTDAILLMQQLRNQQ